LKVRRHRLHIDQDRFSALVQATPGSSSFARRGIKTARKTRREPARRDYRQADRPLVAKMHDMILAGQAFNPTDAARAVVRHATGNGNEASKVTRLVTRYKEEHSTG